MQHSFWNAFGNQSLSNHESTLDELLDRPDVDLTDVLSHEDLIQECKYLNPKLITFLQQKSIIKQLVKFVVANEPTEGISKNKLFENPKPPNSESIQKVINNSTKLVNSDVQMASPSVNQYEVFACENNYQTDSSKSELISEISQFSTSRAVHLLSHTTIPIPEDSILGLSDIANQNAKGAAVEIRKSYSIENPNSHSGFLKQYSSNRQIEELNILSSDHLNELNVSKSQLEKNSIANSVEDLSFQSSNLDLKFPYLASELFACEITSMLDILFSDDSLLDDLFSLLDRDPPLLPSSAGYFRKVVQVLIQRKYAELIDYCSRRSIIDKLIKHIGLYSVMELLIMLGWDDGLGQACFTFDHQIRTNQGWKLITDPCLNPRHVKYNSKIRVAVYNDNRNQIEYRKIKQWIHNKGSTVIDVCDKSFKRKWESDRSIESELDDQIPFYLTTTLNHMWYIKKKEIIVDSGNNNLRYKCNDYKSYQRITAETMISDRFFENSTIQTLNFVDLSVLNNKCLPISDQTNQRTNLTDISSSTERVAFCQDSKELSYSMNLGFSDFKLLNLKNDQQVTAFIELYGIWVGCGTLDFENQFLIFNGITKNSDLVESIFNEVGLKNNIQYFKFLVGEKASKFKIPQKHDAIDIVLDISSWFEFFCNEYGNKYFKFDISNKETNSLTLNYAVKSLEAEKHFMKWVWKLNKDLSSLLLDSLYFVYNGFQNESSCPIRTILTSTVKFRDELIQLAENAGYLAYFTKILPKGSDRETLTNNQNAQAWKIHYYDYNADCASHQIRFKNCFHFREKSEDSYCVEIEKLNNEQSQLILVRKIQFDQKNLITNSTLPTVISNCQPIDQSWLIKENLISKLVNRLAPDDGDYEQKFQNYENTTIESENSNSPIDSSVSPKSFERQRFIDLIPNLLIDTMRRQHQWLIDCHTNAGRALVDVVVKCPPSETSPLVSELTKSEILSQLFKNMFSGCISSLSNSLSVIIVLVQRFANRKVELENLQYQELLEQQNFKKNENKENFLNEERLIENLQIGSKYSSFDPISDPELCEPFISLIPHLPKIFSLLINDSPNELLRIKGEKSLSNLMPFQTAEAIIIKGPLSTPAFGSLRMKVVELCLVLARSRLRIIDERLCELKLFNVMLSIFFQYPWNNLLHGLIESIITSAVEQPFIKSNQIEYNQSFKSSNYNTATNINYNNNNEISMSGSKPKDLLSPLAKSLFQDAFVIQQFIEAYDHNTSIVNSGGQRLGYMGHLIRTSVAIEQLLSRLTVSEKIFLMGGESNYHSWNEFLNTKITADLEKQRPQFEDENETHQSHQMKMEDLNDLLFNDNNPNNLNTQDISIYENQPNFDENDQISHNALMNSNQLNNDQQTVLIEIDSQTRPSCNYNDVSEDFDNNNDHNNQNNLNIENSSNYRIEFHDISETTNC